MDFVFIFFLKVDVSMIWSFFRFEDYKFYQEFLIKDICFFVIICVVGGYYKEVKLGYGNYFMDILVF